jgi:hypothetical protein
MLGFQPSEPGPVDRLNLIVRGECRLAEDKQPTQKKQAKKPYARPAFRFERVFETSALSCGKVGPIETQCRINRKTS